MVILKSLEMKILKNTHKHMINSEKKHHEEH